MIEQLTSSPIIPRRILKKLNKLKPLKGGEWNSKDDAVKEFKTLLRTQLIHIQKSKCAYCGLKLKETSNDEIEHIAPKGGAIRTKHKELTFTILNLVIACHLCNGPTKKGMKETIVEPKNIDYSKCEFLIVHPFIDDPKEHYSWSAKEFNILIQSDTDKGVNSIKMFDLSSTRQSEARAKLALYEHSVAKKKPTIIQDALDYKMS
jgi:uncharacterized protein (TIGR02646 family)